jgi:hypothetical protein
MLHATQTAHHTYTASRADSAAPIFHLDDNGAPRLSSSATIYADGAAIEIDLDIRCADLEAGTDYLILAFDGELEARPFIDADLANALGGFHVAPASEGPAINPHSIWDISFRPSCANPCGMALVTGEGIDPVWVDIYLTAADHDAKGTSRLHAPILDRIDYHRACAIAGSHEKRLLTFSEFAIAAYGVAERSSDDAKAPVTALSPDRTSQFGLIQATGQRWVWGTDGHPDDPRASIFGGSWLYGRNAGSRYANLGVWPGNSFVVFGLRLASDHLTTV